MIESDNEKRYLIKSEGDIAYARRIIREESSLIGFNITDITRIVTATSELIRNILLYAGSGFMKWRVIDNGGYKGIEITFEDNGPGIPDIERAMEKGFSTGNGLGLGLPGAKRLVDEMEIKSEVGKGTDVKIIKYLGKR